MRGYNHIIGADFETFHIEDWRSLGYDCRWVGNRIHLYENGLDTKMEPETRVKCWAMVGFSPEGDPLQYDTLSHDPTFKLTGYTLDEFLCKCCDLGRSLVYFHNLKFDESFIAYAVLSSPDGRLVLSNDWTVTYKGGIRSREGVAYRVRYEFSKGRKHHTMEFRNSAGIFNMELRRLAPMVGMTKGDEALTVGVSQQVLDYCMTDAEICGKAMITYLNLVRKETSGSKKWGWLTAGSTARNLLLHYLRNRCNWSDDKIDFVFPSSGWNEGLRDAYRGATPLVRWRTQWKPTKVSIFDVNSMYPDQMVNAALPYGDAIPCKPEEIYRHDYHIPGFVWWAKCKIVATVKQGHRPCFLLKQRVLENGHRVACPSAMGLSHGEPDDTVYTITDADLTLIEENYDIISIEILYCEKFKCRSGILKDFIMEWYERKSSTKDKGERQFCKLILNSLYGKFGMHLLRAAYDYEMANGHLRIYEQADATEIRDSTAYYLPFAVWTTAYARLKLSRAINALGWEHVSYTDTDSLHVSDLSLDTIKERLGNAGIKVDPSELGALDIEAEDVQEVVVRPKGYALFNTDGSLNSMKMCGINKFDKDINICDFNKNTIGWKLMGCRVPGGTILCERPTELRIDPFVMSDAMMSLLPVLDVSDPDYDHQYDDESYDNEFIDYNAESRDRLLIEQQLMQERAAEYEIEMMLPTVDPNLIAMDYNEHVDFYALSDKERITYWCSREKEDGSVKEWKVSRIVDHGWKPSVLRNGKWSISPKTMWMRLRELGVDGY